MIGRNAVLSLLTCGLILARASGAEAQVLWQKVAYQMSVDQVVATVPGAVRYNPRSGEKLGDGALELVRGPLTQIANQNFQPHFYFQNGKLEQVTLGLDGVNSTSEARLAFEDITNALRAKYGKEIDTTPSAIGISRAWLSGKTNISLNLIAITQTDPILNINYQIRISADAGKL